MSLKKQFAVTLASVGLGAALIGGGTFAYFNDKEEVNNTFAAGTLDLSVNPEVVFDLDDMKPGDYSIRNYQIENNGTLDIGKVYLSTDYTVVDANNNNGSEDLGEHLFVEFKWNWDNGTIPVFNKSMAELKALTGSDRPNIAEAYFAATGTHLPPGDLDDIIVGISFRDNGADQNVFQGDELKVKWGFEATQTEGEAK
ncbi:TasA family protein [Brevibacillus choshinensis]|uniref:TasA family protein n=1 Tax=Brevibacillus choshinensis TaxID=54911 RepID=UPI002E1E4B48|nr:TasA family protein [Brevibacillus choshinensis]MED4754300.1 TasA family protein [Brevibacillus choshinensis]